MEESAPPPLIAEDQITPTHLTPVKAGMPLDQFDDSMEAEPYEPLLPHQSQSVPYAVGSAVLDEYLGPSKPRKESPEKDRSPGKKGSAPFFPRVIRDLTVKEGRLASMYLVSVLYLHSYVHNVTELEALSFFIKEKF